MAIVEQDDGSSINLRRQNSDEYYPLQRYVVTWEIDADAHSPREAAEWARQQQIRPDTTAVVFGVTDEDGETVRVDLLEEA